MPRLGLAVAAVVLVLDQITKAWILAVMGVGRVEPPLLPAGRAIEVLPVLDIVLVWNRGVSFGLFNQDSPYIPVVLSVLTLVVVAGLLVWLWRSAGRMLHLALGLIIGGALGNLVDRVRVGAVVDFIYAHVGDWYWPAFNLADSAITVGAIILVADALFAERKSPKE